LVVGQSGWFAMGNGFGATVQAIERFNNSTYAAGDFVNSGATALNHIARWDGAAWQPLTSANNGQQGVNGNVYALKTYNGSLYAGGGFTTAAGLSSGGLARWDGTNWNIVGGNFSGTVFALEVYNGELIIGGTFPGLNGAQNIAKYNSTTGLYSNLATGGTDSQVRALCIGPDTLLYVGGAFSHAGGVAANRVARWNGSAWSSVRGGVDGNATQVASLVSFHNEVHVFGTFGQAGAALVASPAWARYTTDGMPWVALQPPSFPGICVGHQVRFFAASAAGYFPQTMTWRHNGTPLSAGATPWGSSIAFDFDGVIISNVQAQDAGSYDAVISNSCGSATTSAGTLGVNSADFNGDGDIGTDADIQAFFACLAGSCCPTCGTADFNGDGDFGTDADIEAFFRVLAGGIC
jgi:hypothetical protein